VTSLFELLAHCSSQTHFFILFSRFRRFINRSVARAIASRERQAVRYMFRKLADRKSRGTGSSRVHSGLRSGVFGLAIAGSIYSGLAGQEAPRTLHAEPVARCCEAAAPRPIRRCNGNGFASRIRQAGYNEHSARPMDGWRRDVLTGLVTGWA
jgi:hypothetical protein